MKELKLEHLCGYLPYGLKIRYQSDNSTRELLLLDTSREDYSHIFKPILRPLSDFNNSDADDEIYAIKGHYISLTLNEPLQLLYDEVQVLLKHHFDIHGLIEAGLAIDINQP